MKKAVTLIELIMVVVVIAILSAIAYPIYTTVKERTLDKEAISNLKLIQKAEKFYKMDNRDYCATNNIDTINKGLKLDIPQGTSRSWNYNVTNSTGNATRTNNLRSWNLTHISNEEPVCTGAKCPY